MHLGTAPLVSDRAKAPRPPVASRPLLNSAPEVSRLTGLAPTALRRLIDRGLLPAYRLARERRIRPDAARRFAAL